MKGHSGDEAGEALAVSLEEFLSMDEAQRKELPKSRLKKLVRLEAAHKKKLEKAKELDGKQEEERRRAEEEAAAAAGPPSPRVPRSPSSCRAGKAPGRAKQRRVALTRATVARRAGRASFEGYPSTHSPGHGRHPYLPFAVNGRGAPGVCEKRCRELRDTELPMNVVRQRSYFLELQANRIL